MKYVKAFGVLACLAFGFYWATIGDPGFQGDLIREVLGVRSKPGFHNVTWFEMGLVIFLHVALVAITTYFLVKEPKREILK